jgi:hypothetical protein
MWCSELQLALGTQAAVPLALGQCGYEMPQETKKSVGSLRTLYWGWGKVGTLHFKSDYVPRAPIQRPSYTQPDISHECNQEHGKDLLKKMAMKLSICDSDFDLLGAELKPRAAPHHSL